MSIQKNLEKRGSAGTTSSKRIVRQWSDSGSEIFEFADNAVLVFNPFMNWDRIEGISSALLYKNQKLEAVVHDRPDRFWNPKDTGFWSDGNIAQQEFADYWNAAKEFSNKAYQNFNSGKIDKNTWIGRHRRAWIVTTEGWVVRQSLEKGALRVFDRMPAEHYPFMRS